MATFTNTSLTTEFSNLALGWQVNHMLEPEYWLDSSAKPGAQPENALVKVPANTVGSHTAIIAQSGSGKSFFLGRLIEELLLHTHCRCLILDPNSDFRRINETKPEELWNEASYDKTTRRGLLPHEARRSDFEIEWSKIPKLVRTHHASSEQELLKVWLPLVSADFLAGDIESVLRAEFYHCHAFVQAVAPVVHLRALMAEESLALDLLDEAESMFYKCRSVESDTLVNDLFKQIDFERLPKFDSSSIEEWLYFEVLDIGIRLGVANQLLLPAYTLASIKAAARSIKYVSEVGAHFYFARVREYQSSGVLLTKGRQPVPFFLPNLTRLEVVDLPSLRGKSARSLAVNAFLEQESVRAKYLWSQALGQPPKSDKRRPVFIVVDEAHNLIPAEPLSNAEKSLREQFRTIAAEGRKFGLFLVLVSQRPDKLDPLVLSECENMAIMRLSTASVLEKTRELLRLEDVPSTTLQQVLQFRLGCGLLAGRWADGKASFFYSAARRTVEGGRDLRPEFWAKDPA